jgi:hypothetical protein
MNLANLSPAELRPPNCPTGDRIRIWKPITARNTLDQKGRPINLQEDDLTRIQDVLEETFAPNTRNTYGTGLFAFHLFCDHKGISEEHRAPVEQNVLASFISTLIGIYGGSTIKNYVYGVRSWHIIHGIKWEVNDKEIEALLRAANKLAPNESRKAEKHPWTLENLKTICEDLNKEDPKDAAILACITTAFWGTARLGEVTVPNLKSFNPTIHVKVSDVRHNVTDRNGLEETVIFIPWTKAAREKGENIFWARQTGTVDPYSALNNHLNINKPAGDQHLFAYKQDGVVRPLSRNVLLKRIKISIKTHKLKNLTGHGIRIGSTLEYLLRGVPFDVVKAKGRWQSEAFRGYLRKHAQIMAPYMQANPATNENFVTYAMPPVR